MESEPEVANPAVFELRSQESVHGEIHRGPALTTFDDQLTICSNFRRSEARYPKRKLWGTRKWNEDGTRGEYEWITFEEAGVKISNFASGMRHLGLNPGDKVGIMSKNRTEWLLADVACGTQSLVSVPIYDIYGVTDCEFILNHSEARAIVLAKEHLPFIRQARGSCPNLELVIVMDYQTPDQKWIKENADTGFTHTMLQVEALGAENRTGDVPPAQNDLATIVYTSGTTGTPKGAMILHRSLLAACMMQLPNLDAHPEDEENPTILMSYLPAAHIYDRVLEHVQVHIGGMSGFFQGVIPKLIDDIQTLRPTFLAGVPRVFNKLYSGIKASIENSNWIKRFLFNRAYNSKKRHIWRGNDNRVLADKVVLDKVRERFGGRIHSMVSGSAPLFRGVAEFLRVTMGCVFMEGYGLSECSAAATILDRTDLNYGSVGPPCAGIEVKLVSLPEMDYYVTDRLPRGEIWIRGANTFAGYYKDPEKTAEVLTEDGWVRTGDVGQWLPTGCLKIIDRVKNIFKLAQGEFVCAERVEAILKDCPWVSQVMVHGERTMPQLVAVVVPDVEAPCVKSLMGKDNPTPGEVAAVPAFKERVLDSLRQIAREAEFRRFEFIEDIIVSPVDFTPDNKMLTPSFKLRRGPIKEHFKAEIESMCVKYRIEH